MPGGVGSRGGNAERLVRDWISAFNARDGDRIASLCCEEVRLTPTVLTGRRTFVGRKDVRTWMRELIAHERDFSLPQPQATIDRVRVQPPETVLACGELHVEDERLAPFAMLLTVRDGLVIAAHAYLSDEEMLEQLHYIPDQHASAAQTTEDRCR